MKQTPFYSRHVALGARMVDFADWQMPIQYQQGIVAEHLTTRRDAGLFDVSHMGRFRLTGPGAPKFLRYVLTNDCEKLPAGQAHYTILADNNGGAIDDAYLYRPSADAYILVVNASNKDKDWQHLQMQLEHFSNVVMEDVSNSAAMLALQGPQSEAILHSLAPTEMLPESKRNAVGKIRIENIDLCIARTGYTGESVCFEMFIPASDASAVWDRLIDAGAMPVGLGARDTLRLEAGLPLYGHELGIGKDGLEIPVFAIPQAAFAISFEDAARVFIGKPALAQQAQARQRYKQSDFSNTAALPKVVRQIRLLDKGIARQGAEIFWQNRPVGWVTSGTMVPYWIFRNGIRTDEYAQRAIGLCMVEPNVPIGADIEVLVRDKKLKAKIVKKNLESRFGQQTAAVFE